MASVTSRDEPKISFGNLITITSLVGAIVTAYFAYDKRIAVLEAHAAEQDRRAAETTKDLKDSITLTRKELLDELREIRADLKRKAP